MKSSLLTVALVFVSLALVQPSARADDEILSRIQRHPVESTNVASVGYSRRLHALEIEFTRGAIYRFLEVPVEVYRAFLASDSKGHFIAEHIRRHYRFLRVRAPRRGPSARRLLPNDSESQDGFRGAAPVVN